MTSTCAYTYLFFFFFFYFFFFFFFFHFSAERVHRVGLDSFASRQMRRSDVNMLTLPCMTWMGLPLLRHQLEFGTLQ